MAFLAYHGHLSPSEYEQADPAATLRFAKHVKNFVEDDRELQVTLAKFAAGQAIRRQAAEVR